MRNFINNQKGIVLMLSYFVLVAILGFTAISFMRATHEERAARISNNSLQAFYEAEAGIAYAYFELSQGQNFWWTTHADRNTPAAPPVITFPGAFIDANGCYRAPNRNFEVKTFADPSLANGVIVLSQATVNNATRTVEYRLDRTSAYQFLFFYPSTHAFGTAEYDGRNYAAIHVNGDILLTGTPSFNFLSKLTCGSLEANEGFIRRPLYQQFADLHGNAQGDIPFITNIWGSDANFGSALYEDMRKHFYAGDTYFKTGDIAGPTSITLPYYLQGPGSAWQFDKYAGDGSNTTTAHFTVDDNELKKVALGEMQGDWGLYLLDRNNNTSMNIPSMGKLSGTEQQIFTQLYQNTFANPNQESQAWSQFWNQWKQNHNSDANYNDGRNWERRFFAAKNNWYYHWYNGKLDLPSNVNLEWWQDMNYGDDRISLVNDMALARDIDSATGEPLDRYFLNTQEQPGPWGNWLSSSQLTEEGENKTRVQDKSQGADYVDVGMVISKDYSEQDNIKRRAIEGGIYIGRLESEAYKQWKECINSCADPTSCPGCGPAPERWAPTDPQTQALLDSFTTEKQFYNSEHNASCYEGGASNWWAYNKYKPSRVVQIDVNALRQTVAELKPDFNGIIYVDMDSYQWTQYPSSYDVDADGVMLTNGERLPEGGLSVVTKGNIYIKGNYNLDPDGVPEKNRQADDCQVLERAVDKKPYIHSENDLSWQPAEIITTRAVYTLSDQFPEPSYMPLHWEGWFQYWEEVKHISQDIDPQDFVSGHGHYPSNDWAPTVAAVRSRKPNVDTWFNYCYEGAIPEKFTPEWVGANWPTAVLLPIDTNHDGTPESYIMSNSLVNDVRGEIESAYSQTYSYSNVHGDPDNPSNPDTPSLPNRVTNKHIYNTAIVTPYNTEPYVLEQWSWSENYKPVLTPRIINGSFVQLPQGLANPIPSITDSNERYRRSRYPDKKFLYECRYGRDAAPGDLPNVGLAFAIEISWREIRELDF